MTLNGIRPEISAARMRSLRRWGRRFLLTAGLLMLAYVGFTLAQTRLYQAYETQQFEAARQTLRPPVNGGLHVPASGPVVTYANPGDAAGTGIAPAGGTPLGQIQIPSVGLAAIILQGDDATTLRLGIGHIPGTALPGQSGNVALAGHRDTFFRALRLLHDGDAITLTTLSGTYLYRVASLRVVTPQDTGVLASSDASTLTLVTCFPFYFVGPAPKRFIVRAKRVHE